MQTRFNCLFTQNEITAVNNLFDHYSMIFLPKSPGDRTKKTGKLPLKFRFGSVKLSVKLANECGHSWGPSGGLTGEGPQMRLSQNIMSYGKRSLDESGIQ